MLFHLTTKIRNIMRRGVLQWGGVKFKKYIWNDEFLKGRWDCLRNTPGDCVYKYIEQYCNKGSILDLGCGSGNTGNELDINQYSTYTGVDVSSVAIQFALERTKANDRSKKNNYCQSDIYTYTPCQKYNVILFRESIYYLPLNKIRPLFKRYSLYLENNGVFIVRIADRFHYGQYVDMIESNYKIVEQYLETTTKTIVFVFR